ncbi:GPI-GlcNAc transferase complex, PIG-H component-domain-containing protein [Lipomyces oligophaga]|uniref:GPI-GlcNAc transferase complex, PIG-H component-domain-containing protein n=1 Tax=Lipomyces oligophaga TaxID=45792 RepID=UPI0034CE7CA0
MGAVETIIVSHEGLLISRTAPSSTTLRYTLTNERPKFFNMIRYVLLVCSGFLILISCYLRLFLSPNAFLKLAFGPLSVSALKTSSNVFSFTINNTVLLICSAVVFSFLFIRRSSVEDSILVMYDFGIQIESSGATMLSRSARFIPIELIQDVVINEGFFGFQVIFYLAVIVKGSSKLIVVFPNTTPRRDQLEKIWVDIRECMFQLPVTMSVGEEAYAEFDCVPLAKDL